MGDADEDQLLPVSQHQDGDLSEETQDFRFLSSVSNICTEDATPTIPKRGEKDFEPNPTKSQASSLSASRQAMHNALSFPRLHQPRSHLIAQYCPTTPRGDACVRLNSAKGSHFRTMGTSDSKNQVWLLPEEALFMLERGSLDIRWPDDRGAGGAEGDEEDGQGQNIGELPMSLQGAYASLIGKSGLTLERYIVFAGLRRSGYTVMRAPTWSDGNSRLNGHPLRPPRLDPVPLVAKDLASSSSDMVGFRGLVNRLVLYLYRSNSRSIACPSFGPMVAPGLYRSYIDIYRALSLIPFHHHETKAKSLPTAPQLPFRVTYHVWKPSTPYRKSNPPDHDFRVAVLDAQDTNVPTLEQIGSLLDSMPLDELSKDKRLEQRIKHGRKNVILAVVDTGVVSYLRFSEACFGEFKLFEQKAARRVGSKRNHGRKSGGKGNSKR